MKAWLFVLFTIITLSSCLAQSKSELLTVTDFKTKLTTDKNVQLVDVRTPDEFNAGHLKGALNINYNAADFETQIQKLNKNLPVLLYCKAGVRSAKAAVVMQKLGFKELYNLDGGYMKWSETTR